MFERPPYGSAVYRNTAHLLRTYVGTFSGISGSKRIEIDPIRLCAVESPVEVRIETHPFLHDRSNHVFFCSSGLAKYLPLVDSRNTVASAVHHSLNPSKCLEVKAIEILFQPHLAIVCGIPSLNRLRVEIINTELSVDSMTLIKLSVELRSAAARSWVLPCLHRLRFGRHVRSQVPRVCRILARSIQLVDMPLLRVSRRCAGLSDGCSTPVRTAILWGSRKRPDFRARRRPRY